MNSYSYGIGVVGVVLSCYLRGQLQKNAMGIYLVCRVMLWLAVTGCQRKLIFQHDLMWY